MRSVYVFLILQLFVFIFASAQNMEVKEWDSLFQNKNAVGTFVLKNLDTQQVFVHNPDRSKIQFIPASTYKVLNSLISLQEGVVASVDDTIKWDGVNRNYKAWNKDHTMRSGIKVSCVWFYQELARRVGEARMQDWLIKTSYGNQKIENEIDQFWLEGKLKISVMEQLSFIEHLLNNELPFDNDVQEEVKSIMITDTCNDYTIFSKTGWDGNVGWNIGYVTTKNGTWCFAMNMDLTEMKNAKQRVELTYDVLKTQEIL